MKKSAKNKKLGVLATIGAAVVGVGAGAAAMFLSKKENRNQVKRTVSKTVRMGKAEIAKAKRKVVASKKKVIKK